MFRGASGHCSGTDEGQVGRGVLTAPGWKVENRLELAAPHPGARPSWSQQPARPVIGYLSFQAIDPRQKLLAAFRKGLDAEGFVEGQNVTIEYRSADNRPERLPELAADLVRRRAAVIASFASPAALALAR